MGYYSIHIHDSINYGTVFVGGSGYHGGGGGHDYQGNTSGNELVDWVFKLHMYPVI